MIFYRKKSIRFCEAWYGEEAPTAGMDLVRYFHCPEPASDMYCRAFHTLILDLASEERALLDGAKKKTRYEIRRAISKDGFVFEHLEGSGSLPEFCDFFDKFANQKGLRKIDRRWISLIAASASITLTRVSTANGEPLVWHAYHRGNGRVTLLHSASLFRSSLNSAVRNRLARANRFHHWQDIVHFRSAGELVYDFGGWYEGTNDTARLRINAFKEEFGGLRTKTFICERGITLKGKCFLLIRRFLLGAAI